jgi:uncharacterized protein YndB with AHSA1/START domain
MRAGKNGRSRPSAEPPSPIRVISRFRAAPERVFNAWLDPDVAGRWLFATASRPMQHVRIDARVAGSFQIAERRDGNGVGHTGEYVEIVPRRRLVFTLRTEEHPDVRTRVTVEIAALKSGSELTLIHENVPPEHANETEGRWTGILYGLGLTLTSRAGRNVPRFKAR